jgi:hypothetical protein
MADILKIFLIVVGILSVYVSYWLLAEALFPGLVARASKLYSSPIKISLLGLLSAALPVAVGLLLANLPNPLVKVLGITLVVIPILLGLVGSAGFAQRIGAGLPSPEDASQPWRKVLRGGILLAFAFLLPIVGWIILPIWALVSGFGAFILCVRERVGERGRNSPLPVPSSPVTESVG